MNLKIEILPNLWTDFSDALYIICIDLVLFRCKKKDFGKVVFYQENMSVQYIPP